MRTQVAIIGGGPAGLLLSHILDRNGIDSVVLERQTRQYVLQRIRAGALEQGSVNLLRELGLAGRMDREGYPHDGTAIMWEGRGRFFIDVSKFTGKSMLMYGQTALTEDLYAARDAAGGQIVDEAADVTPHELTSARPYVTYRKNGQAHRVDCDYVAGCDGFHGDADAELAQPVQRRRGLLGVSHQHRFRDLDLQPARRKPGRGERADDERHKILVGHLDRRQVDGNLDVVRPVRGVETGLAQHPFAQRHDQADFLGNGNEVGRRDHDPAPQYEAAPRYADHPSQRYESQPSHQDWPGSPPPATHVRIVPMSRS